MAQTTNQQSNLDTKCANAQPWVRRFVEEHQDGRPWGYAIFVDPDIDDETMDDCLCRIDMLLHDAEEAVFGGARAEFPPFKWEHLGWPEGDDAGAAPEPAVEGNRGDGGKTGAGVKGDAAERTGSDGVQEGQDQESAADESESEEDETQEVDLEDEYLKRKDDENLKDEDQRDEPEGDEEYEDDIDIETVRLLGKLRTHFKWVRDHAKKRRKDYLDLDRSGIPIGVLRNVFLVIDQDAVDSIKTNFADNTWIWAIDPEYTGDAAAMKKNGLKDEYYGYMRVRLQQVVNNFWDARHYHEDELPLPMLWEAAKQSHNCAFVSVDSEEARMVKGGLGVGSALRVQIGRTAPR